jgi:hypothetical protein
MPESCDKHLKLWECARSGAMAHKRAFDTRKVIHETIELCFGPVLTVNFNAV